MVNIFSPAITPRLRYILKIIFRDHLRIPYQLSVHREAWIQAEGPKIHYSAETIPGTTGIIPSGILEETFVAGKAPLSDPLKGARPLFADPVSWDFDVFGAAFFLITRYEEYLPDACFDAMGRFDAKSSWAWKQGWLEEPLVDGWIQALGRTLAGVPATNEPYPVDFQASYDIDLPWCYQHKGWPRTLLRVISEVVRGKGSRLSERWDVWTGRAKDPFDTYDWLDQANKGLPREPVYFFLASKQLTTYDKTPSLQSKAFRSLIRRHAAQYPIGIHPSFHSTVTPHLLRQEKEWLEKLTGKTITKNRFHYIRFRLPGGYRLLLDNAVAEDYSMGYGTQNGFRASYSRPFYWYDLGEETETPLQVIPFCFMEANSYHEEALTGQAAAVELEHYRIAVRKVSGRLTTIWHNNSLGVSKQWPPTWKGVYQDFLEKVKGPR